MNTKAILTPEEQESYLYNAHRKQVSIASEKEIEIELYALLLNYFQRLIMERGEIGGVSYNNPHHIDGLLTISTTDTTHRLLIEAKTQRSLTSTEVWAPLAQALQYTHLLRQLGELLPGVILIATEREWHAVQVDTLAPLLSRDDLPWETAPSTRSPEIEAALQELAPSMLSYTIEVGLNLNEALGAIRSLLMGSGHYATKQHGGNTQQPGVALEVDPATHVYHVPGNQWWRYQGESGSWQRVEPRDLTMELREQATNNGAQPRSLGSLVRSAIEEGKAACAMEEWPFSRGLINTPSGTWSATDGEMTPSTTEHGHRYSTGPMDALAMNNREAPSMHAMLLSHALRAVSGLSRENLMLGVVPDSIIPSTLTSLYAEVLGSYAMVGTQRDILSQWRWSPSNGDDPILLATLSAENGDKAMEQVLKAMERQPRFHDACAIILLRESEYSVLSAGVVDRVDAVVDLTREELPDRTPAPRLLSHSLSLMGEAVDLPRYRDESGDLMLSWFNDSFTTSTHSFITRGSMQLIQ